MRRNLLSWLPTFLVLLAPLFAVACGTTYSSPPPQSTPGEIEGSRYETMRVLAGRLVENLEVTGSELRATRTAEAEMPLLTDLLGRARRFRDGMENYGNPPRYVRDDVNELDRLARDYDSRTRNVQASARVFAKRLEVARRLLEGQTYEAIEAGLNVTSSTITKISNTLAEKGDGLRQVHNKLNELEQKYLSIQRERTKNLENPFRIKMRRKTVLRTDLKVGLHKLDRTISRKIKERSAKKYLSV